MNTSQLAIFVCIVFLFQSFVATKETFTFLLIHFLDWIWCSAAQWIMHEICSMSHNWELSTVNDYFQTPLLFHRTYRFVRFFPRFAALSLWLQCYALGARREEPRGKLFLQKQNFSHFCAFWRTSSLTGDRKFSTTTTTTTAAARARSKR